MFWGKACIRLQLTSLVLLERISKMDEVSIQQSLNRNQRLKYRYLGSFFSDCVPTLDNDTFAIINTQPRIIQGEHWIITANIRHKMYFVGFFDIKASFSQTILQNDDTSTVAFSPQCLWFLLNFCSFPSFQFLSGRNYWCSRFCFNLLFK